MNNRNAILLLALLAASCTAKNENSFLVITKVIPPLATTTGTPPATTTSCTFDPASTEFSFLPFNPAENQGLVAAVVANNLASNAALNTVLRIDTNTFLPHQVVVSYEVIGAGTAPAPNVVPAGGLEIATAGTGTVGFPIFNGRSLAGIGNNTFLRATFHIEGKLLDGSTVHTSEREYLFKICTTPGCGTAGPWGTCL